MRLIIIFAMALLMSCSGEKHPDVSHIEVKMEVLRFEEDLFKIDTQQFETSWEKLEQAYPDFAANYLEVILNADKRWQGDTLREYVSRFMAAYQPVYDSAKDVFRDFTPHQQKIEQAFKYVKHYFPGYPVPSRIITYIGPLDGYGDILGPDEVIVGLHHHLGADFSLYNTELVQETYPQYISKRFVPATIPVNAMKNVVLDLFPENLDDKTLVVQMVEKGKRLYLLSRFLPQTEDYLLIGYTKQQMKDCYKMERVIWDFFIQNNLLQSTDYNINKNYVGEGPRTMELGEAAPGNIGSFTGWQIVKKYMRANPDTNLKALMEIPADKLFAAVKYKP